VNKVVLTYISAFVGFLWQIVTSVQGYEHDNVQNRNGKFFLVLNQAPHNEEVWGISVLDEGD